MMSAVLWRSWLFRASAIPLLAIGIIGALNGPRYDAIVAPAGDLVAMRGADGKLQIVGKHFSSFTAKQRLAADGDGRDPASARDPHALCDRDACIATVPASRLLSVVTATPAFEEDCTRAAVLASALAVPADCQAQVSDQTTLARTGAVGLTWDGSHLVVAIDCSSLEDRPWSPASSTAVNDRIIPAPLQIKPSADPADPYFCRARAATFL
jgi:competence protein ComEC